MTRPGTLHHWSADGSCLAIDERYLPVVICTWAGLTTTAQVDAYFDWSTPFLTRLAREGARAVLISDVLDAGRPNATMRRYIAERSERQRSPERDAAIVDNMVVVDNPVIRGALTAINWLSNEPNELVPVKDLATAFERARTSLRRHGLEAPAGLDPTNYQRPSFRGLEPA